MSAPEEDKLYHTKSIHEDRYRKLQKEKRDIDKKYISFCQKEHGAPSNWLDRSSALQEDIEG